MKTAFIADIHSNLEAFAAVCSSIKQEHVDRVVFLGDIVGYGANPNECIEMLQTLTGYAVAGNHDWACAGRQSTEAFNSVAGDALAWTCSQLTQENKLFLLSLPVYLEENELLAVHATPSMPDTWRYVFNAFDAQSVFEAFRHRLCFIAHTHCPAIFTKSEDGNVMREFSPIVTLDSNCRYIINCGSVGQPRDGDSRASYGIYDAIGNRYYLLRVHYDIVAAQRKIRNSGLPDFLAYRLSAGR